MSTYSSFITTPIKSSVYKTGQSISPRKNNSKVFKSTIMSNSSYRQKSDQNESAESSLIVKLIENQISSEQQYQNLLIQNKELQIKVLALQQEAQRLRKDFKKANSPIQQLKNKVSNAKTSLVEKQKYLQKFYLHLDSKLKSNMHSNLFGRLEKIQKTLEKKYEEEKHDLYLSLKNQHQKISLATLQLQKLRQYRDQLIKAYTQRAIQVSSHKIQSENIASSMKAPSQKKSLKKSSNQVSQKKSIKSRFNEIQSIKGSIKQKQQIKKNSKKEKQLAKQQYKKECKFLKENIQKLKKQKQIVEKDEKLLKLLLNIDQQHKKYSGYILGGYKKMFTIKYRDILLNRKRLSTIKAKSDLKVSSQGSMPDIEGLQKQLNQKVAQRKILQKQIEQRNIGLQNCKQKLNEQIAEYSSLQQQIMKASNKNSGNKGNDRMDHDISAFNPRSTFTGNLSVENHRSTYTSYQKRSEGFQQDL